MFINLTETGVSFGYVYSNTKLSLHHSDFVLNLFAPINIYFKHR